MPDEASYRLLFEKNPMPMWVWDIDTQKFLAVNEAAVAKYGWSREEFLGMTLWDMRPPEEKEALAQAFKDLRPQLATGRVFPAGVYKHRRKDGGVFSVEVTLGPLEFEGRKAMLAMGHDISDRLKAEKALAEGEERQRRLEKLEAVARLASQVAHDFNNLLTAIAGYAELLYMSFPAEDGRRDDADEIRKAVGRATEMTHQLLAFSRPRKPSPVVLDVSKAVAALELKLRAAAGEGVRLELRLASGLGKVSADPAQIEQALLILAANAREAMPEGGSLSVETRDFPSLSSSDRPRAGICVRDTGRGMEKAVLSRLGEPYFTTKGRGRGMGMGLSTVFTICRQAGAEVQVESEPGRGSVFHLIFPCVDGQAV